MQNSGINLDNISQPGVKVNKLRFGWLKTFLLVVILIPVGLVLAGAGYQAVGSAIDARRYPAPGQYIAVNGLRMHISCTGKNTTGLPTVILVASHPDTSSSWSWIQAEVGAATRTCSYDRAGLGWSDLGVAAPTMQQMADDLNALLRSSGESGPYLLVGHSWGGGVTRLYEAAYPDQVAGLVWIESTHPDSWARRGVAESTFAGIDPKMVEGIPLATRLGLFRLFPGILGGWGTAPGLPAEQQAELSAYFRSNKWADYVVAVEHAMPESLSELRQAGSMGSIPLAVIVGDASDGTDPIGLALQEELAGLSTNSTIVHVPGADHSSLVHDRDDAMQVSKTILDMIKRMAGDAPEVPN